MSLVGFKARNHPQQVADPNVDDRAITPEDFAVLDARFRFSIDVAAAEHNARLPRYFSIENCGLSASWAGERVWCNPPYSFPNLERWVLKAWSEADRADLIVMLVPANRTEQLWWQHLIEARRDRAASPLRVEFLPGRLRFLRKGQDLIKPNERPPFGCCLLIWSGR